MWHSYSEEDHFLSVRLLEYWMESRLRYITMGLEALFAAGKITDLDCFGRQWGLICWICGGINWTAKIQWFHAFTPVANIKFWTIVHTQVGDLSTPSPICLLNEGMDILAVWDRLNAVYLSCSYEPLWCGCMGATCNRSCSAGIPTVLYIRSELSSMPLPTRSVIFVHI
jgi:hypothetical protein